MSQLKKGALLSYLNIILRNVIGLFLTPFIIKMLGDSEYGLYLLIGSFVAYLSLLDLGLNNTIIRFVAKYKAQNDTKGEKEFLGTTFWVYIAISCLVALFGFIIYLNLEGIFESSLSIEEMEKAKIMFLILVFNLIFTIPGGSFQAICNAYEHFVFPRLILIIRYISRAVCIIAVLYLGGRAISLVVIDTVLNLIVIGITSIYVHKKLKLRISIKIYDLKLIRGIFSYSFWVFVFGIMFMFQWHAGQVVLGINSNTLTVAVFGVGVLLGGYYGAFATAINGVLIPRATQMVVKREDGKSLTDTMIKIGRLNSFILIYILSGFFLFGKEFVYLWVGETYASSWLIALLIMIVLTLPLIQAFGNSVLEAQRKNRFKSMVSVLTVGVAVIIGFFLSRSYGMFGMIIPLVSAMAINSILMNFYYKKIFDFRVSYFFRNTMLKIFPVYGLLVFICYQIVKFEISYSWFHLISSAFLYTLLYVFVSYFMLMNQYEKSLIIRWKYSLNMKIKR